MKYILVVIYLYWGANDQTYVIRYQHPFPTEARCVAVLEHTQAVIESREDFRALRVECNPEPELEEDR